MKRVLFWSALLLMLLVTLTAQAVHPGNEVTVTFQITDNAESAISARVGFVLDEDVFEFVSAANISADVLNTPPAAASGKFGLLNMAGLTPGAIGSITLKVKDDAPLGSYEIAPVVDSVFNADQAAVTLEVSGETVVVGHVWDEGNVTVVPNCYAEGEYTYFCNYCDATQTEVLPMTEHEEGAAVTTKHPTCTEDGEEVYPCIHCEDDLRTVVIPAYGHTEGDTVVTQEPTCGVEGVQVTQCATCGKTIAKVSIPATGEHQWDDGVVSVAPSVDATGVMLYTCESCGATREETIPASTLQITKQPASTTAGDGEMVYVTVEAEGEGLTYAWYYRNAGLTKFNLSSATTDTYSMEMTEARDGRQVYCVVTDQYGNSVTSDIATISMNKAELAIVKQPASTTAGDGEMVYVSIEAEGEGLTYAWYYRNAGKTKFNLSTSTTDTYSMVMNSTRAGRQVYCVVTDQYGNSVTSDIATISMEAAPVELAITKQPASVTAGDGEVVSVSVTAQGDGLTYVWYYRNAGKTKFNLSSSTTDTYSMVMNSTRAGRQVYCVVTDQYGESVTSDIATISMETAQTELAILKQPVSVTVAEGEIASVSVTVQGDGLTYIWYYRNAGTTKFYKSSTTTNTYAMEMSAARDGRELYCVITDEYGSSVTTDTVTINMETAQTELAIVKQPVSVTVAEGEIASVSVTAQGDGLAYVWYYRNAGTTKFYKSSTTTNTYAMEMSATRDGRELYCVITDKYGNSVTTDTVTINMEAAQTELAITKQPVSAVAADGEVVSVSVTAQGEGLTYAWYYHNAGYTKFNLSSTTTSTYSMVMNSTRDGREVYCVVTDANGNTVQSNTVTLSMATGETELAITKQPVSVTVAEGEIASVSVEAEGEGLTYTWYYKNATATKFVKSSTTTNTYAFEMNSTRDGREVYCIVTDVNGNTVTSNTVTLNMQ